MYTRPAYLITAANFRRLAVDELLDEYCDFPTLRAKTTPAQRAENERIADAEIESWADGGPDVDRAMQQQGKLRRKLRLMREAA